MSNSKNVKEKFVKFISGKGFYAVLAVCLIGAGTAAWVAVDRTINSIEENNKQIVEENSSKNEPHWDFDEVEETKKNQPDVKVNDDTKDQSPKTEKAKDKTTNSEKSSATKQIRPEVLTFVMPIEGEIINNFSDGKLVKDVTLNEWHTHNGVDIKSTEGAAIVAVATGKIENITKDKLWGGTIEISHTDGTTAIYSGIIVMDNLKVGDMVRQKQQIGKADKVPCEIACEPHLHFAMKKEDKWINPMVHMGKLK
ncbi:MAG: M23 family metallopeptidase [Oscillospiraceae bacterium]